MPEKRALDIGQAEVCPAAEEPPKSAEQAMQEFATVFTFSLASKEDLVEVLLGLARRIDVLEACAEHDGTCPDCGEFRSTVEGPYDGDCVRKRSGD